MKRIFAFALALSLVLSLAACGGKPADSPATEPIRETEPAPVATEAPTEAATEEATEAPTEAPAILVENLELVNNEDLIFTVKGFKDNEHLGLQMHVYCENKTDRPMIFSLDGVSVCGIMYDPFWAEEVAAGKAVNSVISFDTYELAEMGVTSVDEISFRLSVIDSEEWMNEPFAVEHFTVYPTGLTADTVEYPEYQHKNGETIIEDGNLRFIIVKVEDTDGDLYTINCFVENKTDRDLLVSWDNVSVNGMMVDPFWASAISAGKMLYTTVNFYRDDLAAQGIENVTEIEFTLVAYDYNEFGDGPIVQNTVVYQVN